MAWPAGASADAVWGWSPGVKLAWTFDRGLTYGIEVSFIRVPDLTNRSEPDAGLIEKVKDGVGTMITRTWGIVVNLDTTFRGTYKARVGGEWVGPFLGLEAGPALIIDQGEIHAALGFTPWLGYQLYAFYTYTLVFGRSQNLHEMGTYLKAPLLGFGGGNTYSDHWDDD
jgi:hypothetical protein